jgi:tetratricopeptide (TPR) repeat protein
VIHQRRWFLSVLLLVFSLVFSSPVLLQDRNGQVRQLIAEGDSSAAQPSGHEKALGKYRQALALDSLNYDVLWRLSRSYRILADHLPTLTDEQKEVQLEAYENAVLYADRAVAVNPRGAFGYVHRAAANIELAEFKNFWNSSGLMNDVRDDCNEAIALDSTIPFTYYILGRAHSKLSGRIKPLRWAFGGAWANRADAIRYFEKAVALQPSSVLYHLAAARAYADNKDYQKSREHIGIILALPSVNEEDAPYRKQASDLLEQIRKK